MEQLCVFGTWHHSWKFWGQNHDIYTHYGKFTRITTIWVRIIYNFTYCIVSDKHFLWSIFWANTQSRFFHVAGGAPNFTLLLWPHWYVARHGVRKAKWLTASEGGKSAVIKGVHWVPGQNSWLHNCSLTTLPYALARLEGTWTESLKLQTNICHESRIFVTV